MREMNACSSFTLELTARCNNNCRHCYINLPAGDTNARMQELSAGQIMDIADQAVRMGAIWCTITGYLSSLAPVLVEEQSMVLKELHSLRDKIDHIKEIVAMQQSYAKVSGVAETMSVTQLVEDALKLNLNALARHQIQVERQFENLPPANLEKHKILQILLNLIRNAKHALEENDREPKTMTLRISSPKPGHVAIQVGDNGVGIPPENLTRIFAHGFTTRKDGHGFGLHSGALAARELGGSLTAESPGLGQGATFTLELPLNNPASL